MKKKIEAELTSLAHGILQMKNRDDIIKLRTEAQQLYEKLQVLAFVEEHFTEIKPTAGLGIYKDKLEEVFEGVEKEENIDQTDLNRAIEDIRKKNSDAFDRHRKVAEAPPAEIPDTEPVKQETNPAEDTSEEPVTAQKPAEKIRSMEELGGNKSSEEEDDEPVQDVKKEEYQIDEAPADQTNLFERKTESREDDSLSEYDEIPVFERKINQTHERPTSLNQRLAKTSQIGMNERLGYIRHLFQGKSEDYERVMSQLNTKESYGEAMEFIDQMVKPEYDHWEGKETYEERFKELIAGRFE